MYLPEAARFSTLLKLPEGDNIGKAINDAMKAIEEENEDLKGVLPRTYNRLDNATLFELLKTHGFDPDGYRRRRFRQDLRVFPRRIRHDRRPKGRRVFHPDLHRQADRRGDRAVPRAHFDPACGSGGMFVQSARFVANHKRNPSAEISVYGQEKTSETVRLCKMNLAVHGLSGDIREGNTYYEDMHDSAGHVRFRDGESAIQRGSG